MLRTELQCLLRGNVCELEVSDAEVPKEGKGHFVIIAARQGYLLYILSARIRELLC